MQAVGQRAAFGRQYDMTHGHHFATVCIGLIDKAVAHRLVDEVRSGEFRTVALHVVEIRGRGVESRILCSTHLQLVVYKHVDIVVERHSSRLLGVVFLIKIFKFAQLHILAADSHHRRIGRFLLTGRKRLTRNANGKNEERYNSFLYHGFLM